MGKEEGIQDEASCGGVALELRTQERGQDWVSRGLVTPLAATPGSQTTQCCLLDFQPPELLQVQTSQEKEQKESLGQALKRLENVLKQALERIPELQGVVGDW